MKSFKELLDLIKRGPSDVVGLDIGSSAIKAVRMKRAGEDVAIVSAEILAPAELPSVAHDEDEEEEAPPQFLSLPGRLKAPYASLAVSGQEAVIKLLSIPGHFDSHAEGKVVQSMGLKEPDKFRVGYKLVSEGRGKTESKVLAVALPEKIASYAVALLPSGRPAPFSIEVSGLATMAAFLNAPGAQHADDAVAVADFGAYSTAFAIFNKGVLGLFRKFDFGADTVLDKIEDSLGVDRETALGILNDGSFDVSQFVNEVLAPRIKQFILSRDFVERRENCRIKALYVSGGLAVSGDIRSEIGSAMDLETQTWNPLEGYVMPKDSLGPGIEGQEWRLAAAAGACLATLRPT